MTLAMTLEEIAETLDRIENDVHTIHRGVYGDKLNGRPGLIETDQQQHIRIKRLEDFHKKAAWIGGGAFVVLEFIYHAEGILKAIIVK